MNMKKHFAALAALVTLCSLAMGQEAPPWKIGGQSQGAVWALALDTLAELGLSAQGADKASGLITSDWASFKKKDGYAKWEKPPAFQMIFDRSGKVTIRIEAAQDGSLEVRVDGTFKQTYGFKGPEKMRPCPSTGILEKKILDSMKKKLGQ
jgi:uncharacterized lipoprotein